MKLSQPIVRFSLSKKPDFAPQSGQVFTNPDMKRTFAYLFLFLYSYNLAGYLVVFSVRQDHVRSEIKRMLKESVPQSDLLQLVFHTQSLEQGQYPLQWIEDHEFRYAGGMYDIVRSHTTGDSTYYLCVNDIQEEALFADLDSHVQREMGSQSGRLDAFKDVFKESFVERHIVAIVLPLQLTCPDQIADMYESIVPDIAFPPPRTALST